LLALVLAVPGPPAAGDAREGTSRPAPALVARDYPVQPVPFTQVRFADAFWAPRIETNRSVTIPFAFRQCEETGRVRHFQRAAAILRQEPLEDRSPPGYPFDDSDLYKVIEGACYTLSVHPDRDLEAYLDRLVQTIGAAQEPDGYLYTTRTIDPARPHPWAGTRRWELEKVDSHELYNLGHLYEAAAAHHQATGKRSLLEIALRTADLLVRSFGPDKQSIWPGHQITEMGLARLYRVTGDRRYLELAKFLLDVRGPDGAPGSGREYNQSQSAVLEQREAVGHAVRATYMYSGMADVAALSGDAGYVAAIGRIWEDVVGRKLYITGGIGARGSGEAFGDAWELPNLSAYCETCAAIGNVYWNHRLFLLHGDARYLDVMERALYNGVVSGVARDGRSFFYPNPLESNGRHERRPWFGVACCPSNLARFLASVPGYAYGRRGNTLFVNLYAAGSARLRLDSGQEVELTQETSYPWQGEITLVVKPERPTAFALALRIPGWARQEPVPSDLYRFLDRAPEPSLLVNGAAVPLALDRGFARLERAWAPGDTVRLTLPMPVRRVVTHENVAADRGRVALQRGPLVYCAEWPDNPDGRVRNLMLADDAPLTAELDPSLLGGVVSVRSRASSFAQDAAGGVNRREQAFKAIPYHAWANRGPGEMVVWIPRREASVRPHPWPTVASRSSVRASGTRDPRAANDLDDPLSGDPGTPFHWWPSRGTTEWIEYGFEAPASVSASGVFWLDETSHGETRVPAAWRLLYRDGDQEWRPVRATGPYGLERDRYNRVAFEPVRASALRLEVTLQPGFTAGIHEWRVE
jgi:DUF1680 family protein